MILSSMEFSFALTKRLAAGLQNFTPNNYDWLRFRSSWKRTFADHVLHVLSRVGWLRVSTNFREQTQQRLTDIQQHAEGLEWLWSRLCDDASRNMLVNILAYRVLGARHIRIDSVADRFWSALPAALGPAATAKRVQPIPMLDGWLDDYDLHAHGYPIRMRAHRLNIMNTFFLEQYRYQSGGVNVGARPGDIVVDGGGCWGDTALYFSHLVGASGRVHVFEFSPANLKLLRENLARNSYIEPQIEIHESALWHNTTDTLSFEEAGPGTALGTGNCKAPTQTIDAAGLGRVDFIKLDIEGAEANALRGARSTIAKDRPTLAVALYHSLADFVTLPRLIQEIEPGYDFYLGHSTIHHEETILFATPSRPHERK